MRIPTSKLQHLAIFTTVLTGGGIGTMYYLMQKQFSKADFYKLALQKLEACPVAMEWLGCPPLKVHNIHLNDRTNRIDGQTAQLKIPVSGSKTGGYLYMSSVRDPDANAWRLKQAVLKIREGATINLLDPPAAVAQVQETDAQKELDKGYWS
ncbi:cytochrome c oxidase assembly factor 1 homolog [Takifugu rubripes]|uniref:Cytochrome C oxidase assembly factor 1 n=1 Tax=Takifugu rubripes TaxID=31033 RepID=H2TXN5_TAKRU|nr:cytochrome c oxidase assembly factor 1 homolog [Takifugu rubripes]XP_056913560.1 cytochrome c oxidase assembly factor 1 homolog [Takifugu flavidus]